MQNVHSSVAPMLFLLTEEKENTLTHETRTHFRFSFHLTNFTVSRVWESRWCNYFWIGTWTNVNRTDQNEKKKINITAVKVWCFDSIKSHEIFRTERLEDCVFANRELLHFRQNVTRLWTCDFIYSTSFFFLLFIVISVSFALS